MLKFIIIALLVGCAGSSSNNYEENSLYDTNSTKISELKLIMVDGKTLNIKTDAGSFSRINGQTVIKLDSSEETLAFIDSQNKKTQKPVMLQLFLKEIYMGVLLVFWE